MSSRLPVPVFLSCSIVITGVFSCVFFGFFIGEKALGQTKVRLSPSIQIQSSDLPPGMTVEDLIAMGALPPGMEVSGATPGSESISAQDQARLQKLQTIEFDRLPSTIMKTWSELEKTKPEKPRILIEDEERQAAAKKAAEEKAALDKTEAEAAAKALEAQESDGALEENTNSDDELSSALESSESGKEASGGDIEASGNITEEATVTEKLESKLDTEETEVEAGKSEATEAAEEALESQTGDPSLQTTEPDSEQPKEGQPDSEQPVEEPLDPEEAKRIAEEEAAKAKAAEEEAKRVAEVQAARTKFDAELLEWEISQLQRAVTLGNWKAVKSTIANFNEQEQGVAYSRLLTSLLSGPSKKPQTPQQGRAYLESNEITPEDIIGIAAASPKELEKEQLLTIAGLFRLCLSKGNLLESFLPLFRDGVETEDFPLTRRNVAIILAEAGEEIASGDFLPSPEEAEAQVDRQGLNLLARHFLAIDTRDGKALNLESAWRVTQAALVKDPDVIVSEKESTHEQETEKSEEESKAEADAIARVEKMKEAALAEKAEALRRAVDLAPRVREELGRVWLDESFTERLDRGKEILASIGSSASIALQSQPTDADARVKWLELQSTAANALLDAAPQRAEEWKAPLNLMARNWLREAEFSYQFDTATRRGPSLERDIYGNFFYNDWMYQQSYQSRGNRPSPIKVDKILDSRPTEAWMPLVDESVRPKFSTVLARLHLKIGEEDLAFPFIEELAQSHPDPAKELVDEFLRVWASNHNPNQNTRNNSYIYMYGFEQRANSIPLTRSKQERNLRELSEWVARLRKLPVKLDVDLLANAFTTAHSAAEIYRIETIASVFGSLEGLEPKTLSQLIQRMRSNLVGVWRDPNTQKDAKTNRRKKDIEQEVQRGYEVATGVVQVALAQHPNDWSLHLAAASILHDHNNYVKDLARDSEFSSRRMEAFEGFKRAAELYVDGVEELKEFEETTEPFETWFHAALGACDLGAIDHEQVVAENQMPLIRRALENLPGERSERHIGKFANSLFTHMGSASPAVKFRYIRSGLDIARDHHLAEEAREVYDYYKDLVTEIELDLRIDGADEVGSGSTFGVFVDIRHTKEIERESGGFSKYLVNQNNQQFSYNYGRPTENYRDKFEDTTREALKEHFEILSITFNHPKSNSKATAEYGWRITPYAYLLLKPRGPEIDKIPTLRFDLDFLDTSGYAVIPIESSPVPIDASAETGPMRPFQGMSITQTLDERQAKDGKLVLEIKASALGLVPDMSECVDLAPVGFKITDTQDDGVSVVKFDEDSDEPVVVTERLWTVTMNAEEDLLELPKTFTFAKPRVEVSELEHLRYVDADLETVEATIPLVYTYGEPVNPWPTRLIIGGVGILLLGILGFVLMRRAPQQGIQRRFNVPLELTPFTVIGLLRSIERSNGFEPSEKDQLTNQIRSLEEYYFIDVEGEAPDLASIATRWVQMAS